MPDVVMGVEVMKGGNTVYAGGSSVEHLFHI